MKKLLIIFFLLPLFSFAQKLETDSINYKAIILQEYLYGENKSAGASETIFEFRNRIIHTSNKNQTQTFYLQEDWYAEELEGYPIKQVQAKDAGGFKCLLFFGYHEKTKTYFIIIGYNNVDLFYKIKITEETIEPIEIVRVPYKWEDIEYTDEQIKRFINFSIYWILNRY